MQYRKKGHPIEHPRDLGDIYFQLCIWSLFFLLLFAVTLTFTYTLWQVIKMSHSIYETLRITAAIL